MTKYKETRIQISYTAILEMIYFKVEQAVIRYLVGRVMTFQYGGIDDDYLVGNEASDQIYGSEGDYILMGNAGADYFDCGGGTDVVIDFNITESDDNVGIVKKLQVPNQ